MASEFFLLASLVLIGVVFFSVFQIYTITQSEETKKAEIKAEAERIASLAYKISKDPSQYMQYCLFTLLSNITVENGLLRYESGNYKFAIIVPKEIENSQIFETTKVCFVKKDGKIALSKEAGNCNLDRICEIDECKVNCPDCYGPNNNCLNDNFCNLNIGENCKNSLDCPCRNFGQNYVCCPENPSSNKYGCLYLPNKKGKGEECYCDDECSSSLRCNPVDPSFTSYKKACCEEGKSWNGSECITIKSIKKFRIVFVPISYERDEFDKFKSDAENIYEAFLQVAPFRECPNPSERVEAYYIDPKDCSPSCPSQCFDEIFKCVQNSPYRDKYDIIQGICKTGKCVNQWGFCGISLLNGISFWPISQDDYICHLNHRWSPLHEMGHTFGLNHIDSICDEPADACLPPNGEDCQRPSNEKQYFLMTYCPIRYRFGPAGYAHIKSILNSMKYLEGC